MLIRNAYHARVPKKCPASVFHFLHLAFWFDPGCWDQKHQLDVAATAEKDERGYTGEPFVLVLALCRNLKWTSADTPRSLLLTTAALLCR